MRTVRLLGPFASSRAPASVLAGPADDLLRLVPRDAGATLVLENLRGNAASFFASPLARGLNDLPAVAAWKRSDAFRKFVRSRGEIEAALGADLKTLRDDLFGEAVVLALQPGPGGDPTAARGLLLTKVSDRALLDRFVKLANETETNGGNLVRVERIERGGMTYSHREFRAGTKPDEWYATLEDGVFAWSNSEALISGLFERRSGTAASLATVPGFQKVRRGLPSKAAVSLFLDPAFASAVLKASREASPRPDDRAAELLAKYLGALTYVGAAIEWRDGVFLHVHEVLDPALVPEFFRKLAASPRGIEPPWRPGVGGAFVEARASLDVSTTLEAFLSLLPEKDRPRVDNLLDALSGVLLGQDVRKGIAPKLGPDFAALARPSVDDPSGEAPRYPCWRRPDSGRPGRGEGGLERPADAPLPRGSASGPEEVHRSRPPRGRGSGRSTVTRSRRSLARRLPSRFAVVEDQLARPGLGDRRDARRDARRERPPRPSQPPSRRFEPPSSPTPRASPTSTCPASSPWPRAVPLPGRSMPRRPSRSCRAQPPIGLPDQPDRCRWGSGPSDPRPDRGGHKTGAP